MTPMTYTITKENYPWNMIGLTEEQKADLPQQLFIRSSGPDMLFDESSRKIYVAIVGTRDPSTDAEYDISVLINALYKRYGKALVIVSGLALGIDTIAHRYALQKGIPTIAVIGNGVGDKTYPSQNFGLSERIASTPGCGIVSEYPDGTAPQAPNFLRRNRIIAAMSDILVLVQSKTRGGGVVTARLAHDINRKVFAFPGRWDDRRYGGNNQLIQEGVAEIITDTINIMVI